MAKMIGAKLGKAYWRSRDESLETKGSGETVDAFVLLFFKDVCPFPS